MMSQLEQACDLISQVEEETKVPKIDKKPKNPGNLWLT